MTEAQKEKIQALRWRGHTYKDIGNVLGLPTNTIKTYCWRNGIAVLNQDKSNDQPVYAFCQNCGQPIAQAEKQKPRKFCGAKCREAWWNKNRQTDDKCVCIVRCAYCGEAFEKYKHSQKRFCCHRHYIFHRFGEVPTT